MKKERKIVCIVGPTASGKTGWGVSVARKFNGEIISADSRQVYKKLDIGTGKDLEDYGDIKYHLIDVKNPGEKFTLFDWLKAAREAIDDILERGKLPVVVGGTGLYVQALVEGFELKVESQKSKVKRYLREDLESKSLVELQKIFHKLTTKSSNLKAVDLKNPHRIIRAIEKFQSGEIAYKEKPNFQALQIAIDLSREVLYDRIDYRVEERFKQGMLEEIKHLFVSNVDTKWLLSLGLEYRTITEYLLKKPKSEICNTKQKKSNLENSNLDFVSNFDIRYSSLSFEEMKQELKYKIHAFARRQLTWFRRFPEIILCKDLKLAEKEIKKFLI